MITSVDCQPFGYGTMPLANKLGIRSRNVRFWPYAYILPKTNVFGIIKSIGGG